MPTALQHGLPALLVVVLIALIFRLTGSRRPSYRLSEPWTHAPILWAAIDEVVPGGHGGHDHDGHASTVVNVGGGASGRW